MLFGQQWHPDYPTQLDAPLCSLLILADHDKKGSVTFSEDMDSDDAKIKVTIDGEVIGDYTLATIKRRLRGTKKRKAPSQRSRSVRYRHSSTKGYDHG